MNDYQSAPSGIEPTLPLVRDNIPTAHPPDALSAMMNLLKRKLTAV
jgi:hypothetical protein